MASRHLLQAGLLLPLLALVPAAAGASDAAPAPRVDDGDEQYRFLVGLVEKGLHSMAVDEAQTFLERHGSHAKAPLARYRLAGALFELERFAEAAGNYAPLAERSGFEYRAESAFRLGECLLETESYDGAAQAFGAVLRLDQDYLHTPATFFLAETQFQSGDPAAAEKNYRVVARASDSEYAARAQRGLVWCAWEARDLDGTVKRARTYLERHAGAEDADEVRILLGEALLASERPDEALSAFGQVRSPEFGDAMRRGAGFAYAARDEHAKAAAEFAALVSAYPESRFAQEARLQVGIQTLRAGDAAGALRALRGAARTKDPEALYWLAEAQVESGENEAALQSLQRALQAGPDEGLTARLQIARGDVLQSLGRTREALAAYESGGSDYALYAAAVASLNEGDGETAGRLAETLLAQHDESRYRVQAALVLGEARFALADYAGAEEAFLVVLREEPEEEHAAQARNRLGWCRYQAGDLSGAARRFRELIEAHRTGPASEEGVYMLGRVLLEADRPDEARQANALYLRRHPDGPHVDEVLYANARAQNGSQGLRSLETLLANHTDSDLVPRALLELGDRLSEEGRFEEAAPHYAALLTDHAGSEYVPEARYGLGWCSYQAGRHAESARLLAEVGQDENADDSLRAAAWELCVWASAKAGDPRAANEAWRRFARTTDDDARRFESLRTVVAAWRDAGQPESGQRALDELLGVVSDDAVAVEVLVEGAYLALEEGDLERADAQIQVARRRAAQAPEVAEASFFVGEARFENGEDARAIELYTQAAAVGSPVRARALYKLGFARMRKEDLAGAAEAFGTVVADHSDDELWGESLFLMGEALYRMDRLDAAAQAFERLQREAPRHEVRPKGLFRLGLVMGRMERWNDCETALTLLARETPEFTNLTEAELWRGRALAAQRKRRAARQAFERVTANDKGELAAQARLGLGRLLEDEGRTEEALSEYLKVAVLFAHDEEVAEALYRAGTCLEALGDTQKALEQYREVVSEHPDARFAAEARRGVERLGS